MWRVFTPKTLYDRKANRWIICGWVLALMPLLAVFNPHWQLEMWVVFFSLLWRHLKRSNSCLIEFNEIRRRQVTSSMAGVVRAMDAAMKGMNLEKISSLMDKFEQQFEDLDVQSSYMENTMSQTTTTAVPQGDVDSLLQQVADEAGFVPNICNNSLLDQNFILLLFLRSLAWSSTWNCQVDHRHRQSVHRHKYHKSKMNLHNA